MSLSEIFKDIEPIAADDGPHPVCCIDYPREFEEAYIYYSGKAVIILMKRSVANTCCVFIIPHLYCSIACAALTLHQSRSWPLAEFRGMGVTSLSTPTPPTMIHTDDHDNCRVPKWVEEEEEQERIILYVGTKRGKLKRVNWTKSINEQLLDTVSVQDITMTSNESRETRPDKIGKGVASHQEDFVFKPYPIYSMAIRMSARYAFARNDGEYVGGNKSHREIIFCGGADRFVTILEKEKMDDSDKWTFVQRLGPHTGWVKDVVQCTTKSPSDSVLLFSIGCNCIEVWKMEDTSQRSMLYHWKKLTIESSVTMGCTLSSDLLCLGIYKGEYLFAAGVDGRIHLWKICESLQKADVLAAHDGRVNAMFVCELLGILITVGNDGKVLCLEISPLQLKLRRTCHLDLCEMLGYGIKVTSLTVIDEDTSNAIVAVGTASGLVVLAKVCYANDEETTSVISITFLGADCMLDVGADCTVYALQSLERISCLEGTKYCVAVGHQNGMHVWEFVLKDNVIRV